MMMRIRQDFVVLDVVSTLYQSTFSFPFALLAHFYPLFHPPSFPSLTVIESRRR